jgi:hypothetical protein
VSGEVLLLIFVLVAVLLWVAARETRLQRNGRSLVRLLEERDQPLYCTYSNGLRSRILTINGQKTRWTQFVVAVLLDEIVLYRVAPGKLEHRLSIAAPRLRWFGRPEKYTRGANEMWFHAEVDGEWALVQLRLHRSRMQALVRALKEIATPDQVTAYRRHRPYIHYGPVSVRPATQDLHGAWKLDTPLDLYLMPAFLIVLEGTQVQRTLPLNIMQEITAVERLDRPRAAGLVRFVVEEEAFAFALDQYTEFAEALAEAAKRTLEDPLQWQRKKKKPDDFDFFDQADDDDDFYEDSAGYGRVGWAGYGTDRDDQSRTPTPADLSDAGQDRLDDDDTWQSSRITD